MPVQESTATRQLRASIVCAITTQSNTQAIDGAKAYRQVRVDRMAQLIADEYESLPAWVDGFCHNCDINECAQGSPEQLAARLFDLGWSVEGGLKGSLLLCPSCTCGEVV